MRNSEPFKLGTYTMKELALCYFEKSVPTSASCQLKKWIVKNENLILDLKNAGYRNGQRMFTPLQVKIIVQYLGEP